MSAFGVRGHGYCSALGCAAFRRMAGFHNGVAPFINIALRSSRRNCLETCRQGATGQQSSKRELPCVPAKERVPMRVDQEVLYEAATPLFRDLGIAGQ
jgi:hypothetical protein